MAIKAIMLRKRLDVLQGQLAPLTEKDAEMETRERELETAATEASTSEELDAVNELVTAFEQERSAHVAERDRISAEIQAVEQELQAEEQRQAEAASRPAENHNTNNEGENNMEFNIRSLPMGRRAIDAIPADLRSRILGQQDVKDFLQRMREMKGQQRSISGGELLIPVVLVDMIAQNLYRYSKLLRRVRLRNVAGTTRQTVMGVIPEAVWTEARAALNQLDLTVGAVTMDGYKVGGFIPVCNALLEDSDIDLAGYVVEAFAEAIGLAVDKAILYGTGVKMPLGIVTRLAQTAEPAGYPADAPAWVDLHTSNVISINNSLTGADFWAALVVAAGNTFTKYSRGEQFWAMNSKTYAKLKSKVITFTASGDVAANVFGYLPVITGDVEILEFMPDNDIVGGYGDLYLFAQREGMSIEASREAMFIQDNTVFRGKIRADGMPVVAGAFVAMNIAGSSPTTVATFAADTANDADLQSLAVGSETLSPTFDPATQSYAITASGASGAVTAIPAQNGAQVGITYNDKNVINGGTITFATGTKNLVVTVKNGNAVKTYTVAITKS